MIRIALALGSNLGDRAGYLRDAAQRLATSITGLRLSSFHETEPVGVERQPQFLNAAAVGITPLSPRALLERLLEVEAACGRERPYPGAPRTLDLDLILYGDVVLDEPGLVLPHPRFRTRGFVLMPLAEIAPDWLDPVTQLTVAQLLARLGAS